MATAGNIDSLLTFFGDEEKKSETPVVDPLKGLHENKVKRVHVVIDKSDSMDVRELPQITSACRDLVKVAFQDIPSDKGVAVTYFNHEVNKGEFGFYSEEALDTIIPKRYKLSGRTALKDAINIVSLDGINWIESIKDTKGIEYNYFMIILTDGMDNASFNNTWKANVEKFKEMGGTILYLGPRSRESNELVRRMKPHKAHFYGETHAEMVDCMKSDGLVADCKGSSQYYSRT